MRKTMVTVLTTCSNRFTRSDPRLAVVICSRFGTTPTGVVPNNVFAKWEDKQFGMMTQARLRHLSATSLKGFRRSPRP